MKFKTVSFLFLLLALSCGRPDPVAQKQNLSGYWEIETVTFPDGGTKDFNISTTLDFIGVNGDSGTRAKVFPQLDGSFLTNEIAEEFTMKIEADSLRLYYKTPFASWKETVLVAKDNVLKIKIEGGKIYTYKKFEKFNFNE